MSPYLLTSGVQGRSPWSIIVAATLLLLSALVAPASAGQRVALVIGNASYAHAPSLANPLNDATDIGASLERLGFAVTRIDNAGYTELRRGLQQFSLAASASEMAVVFYAGHGIEVDKRNFLIPVDARLLSDTDVEFEAVPLDQLSRAVERAKGLRLIVLDACRDNPFAVAMQRSGATRSIGRGLASVEPSGETLVAYAAKEGTVAADGEGRNSPYTTALLAHLEEPGLEVGLMFRKVRDAVLAKTGGHQEPFWYGSLSSEGAYLAALPEPEPEEPTPIVEHGPDDPKPGPVSPGNDRRLTAEELAAERVFWESVKDSTHAADFEAYLEQFPGGTYDALARNRLKRLTGKQEEETVVQVAVIPDEPEPVVSPEPPAPTPELVEASLGLERAERRQIQMGLASLGFDPGPADGLFGRRTRNAIGYWQTSQGATPTGHLDAEAAKALMAEAKAAAEMAAKRSFSRDAAMESLSKALHAVERIQDDFDRATMFAHLAEHQSKAGDDRGARRSIEEALAAKNRLDHDHWGHDLLLERVAAAQAASSDFQGAFATAWRITDTENDDRAVALANIAGAQAEAGDARGAARTIGEAMSIAARIGDEFYRSLALVHVGRAQVMNGDIRGALETAQRIKAMHPLFYVRALTHIAAAQVEDGDAVGAAHSIADASRAALRIADEDDRVSALCSIAGVQAEAGDARGAAHSIAKALEAAQRIADEFGDGRGSFHDIAYWQATIGDVSGALATVQRVEHEPARGWPLKAIAEAQARAGDISNAWTITQRILDGRVRAQSFAGIAEVQMKAGDTQGAARSIAEALTTAGHIGDYQDSVWAYTTIADAQLEGGKP